jgi:hypothetical protein
MYTSVKRESIPWISYLFSVISMVIPIPVFLYSFRYTLMAEFCGEAGRKYAYISNWVFLVAGSVGKTFPLFSSQSHISYLCTYDLYGPGA